MRRAALLLCAALLAGVTVPAVAATGVDTTGTTYSTDRVVVPLVFPVLGATSYSDSFLACRSGCARKHMGQDLMGAKMSPLVAACDGTVVSLKRETTPTSGNYLVIACDHGRGAGWSVLYLHVNNDRPGTDDGKGTAQFAFPAGIAPGARVLAGQLVGWRGDSGNAESTGPHLHFELRKGTGWSGTVYNAFPSLQAARRLTAPLPSGPHPDGTLIRTPQHDLYLVAGLEKRLVSPGVLAAGGLSVADAIDVPAGEVSRYLTKLPLWPRDGALLRDPAGAAWRVLGATRYAVTPAAGQRSFPVTDAELGRLRVVEAPTAPLTTGMLVHLESGVHQLGADGLLHPINGTVMALRGYASADVVTLPVPVPVDPPVEPPADGAPPAVPTYELPEIGDPVPPRDGTLATVPGIGLAVLSGGVVRRVWDSRELVAYGYAGKRRRAVPAENVAGWPTGEIAGSGELRSWR